ncbi:hypothetical protein [Stygiobacter electus]|uniref:Uncharacterized protein n=1 Tax=Stygiobacter electus TaxID=3032292 RepID=A0AAE3NYD3_9BACT|nr:hypothetical protein [Stygiobacter electus]MDF1610864.1 hypothetical protein [Stygiobacter electus]
MELVPIVITALKIVTVLAVIVLGLSYISFKIKQKSIPQKNFLNIPQIELEKNFVQHVKKRLTHITKEIPARKKEQPRKQIPSKPQNEVVRQSKEKQPRVEILKTPKQPLNSKEEQKKSKDLSALNGDILEKYADEENDKLFTLKTENKKPK